MKLVKPLVQISRATLGTLVILLATHAMAQKATEDVTINLFVNYGYAFRDKHWTPVDVTVLNNLSDMKGTIELRAIASDTVQSPVYSIPVDIPKSSQKHYQFHCFMQDTSELEIRVLEGGRRLFGLPAKIKVTPIRENDLLMLALDDSGSELGLGLLAEQSRENESDNRRIHPETITNDKLSFLSTYPQVYEGLDLIMLGKTDPARIGQAQQDVIRNYVLQGGCLVLCLGEYADLYKGTWLEELAGATIGTKVSINEAALAAECFPEPLRSGAVDHRDVVMAELKPLDPSVRRVGEAKTIATRRAFGKGYVYALAVDADSHALQGCAGFRKLWSEILVRHNQGTSINMDAAAQQTINLLPSVSGVSIHSKEAVLIYLGLYFFVAIVANWLVFNRLKRRELAWVMLVVFSIGFTGYAMVFGTAGRARTSELEQIEVLHVPVGGGMSDLHSLVGVLTARTGNYALSLGTPNALVKDTAGFSLMRGPGYDDSTMRVRPFNFSQTSPSRVEGLRVGASEMRIMQVDSSLDLRGGIGGAVTMGDDDSLSIDLTNETGYELEKPYLLFKGRAFPLTKERDGRLTGRLSASQIRNAPDGSTIVATNSEYLNPGYAPRMSPDGSTEELMRQRLGAFKGEFVRNVFSETGVFMNSRYPGRGGYPYGYNAGNADAPWAKQDGPFVFSWIKNPPAGSIKSDQEVPTRIAATLLVADVATAGKDIPRIVETELPIGISGDTGDFMRQNPMSIAQTELKKMPAKLWVSTVGIPITAEIIVETGRESFRRSPVEFVPVLGAETWKREEKTVNYGQVTTLRSNEWANSISTIDAGAQVELSSDQRNLTESTGAGSPQVLWKLPIGFYGSNRTQDPSAFPMQRIAGELRSDVLANEFNPPQGQGRMRENPTVSVRAYARVRIETKNVAEGLWK